MSQGHSIGDNVWFLNGIKPRLARVSRKVTDELESGEVKSPTPWLANGAAAHEVFATRQDLIAAVSA